MPQLRGGLAGEILLLLVCLSQRREAVEHRELGGDGVVSPGTAVVRRAANQQERLLKITVWGEKKLDSVFVNYLCSTEEKKKNIARIGFFGSADVWSAGEYWKFYGCYKLVWFFSPSFLCSNTSVACISGFH